MEASLRAGADVIVNTDADNQYCADDIPKLLEPIARGEAQIVIGARPISATKHFSPLKKILQRLGSRVVRMASRTNVADAPSGFRAMTRERHTTQRLQPIFLHARNNHSGRTKKHSHHIRAHSHQSDCARRV